MQQRKVVPIVVTQRHGDKDLVRAFEIAERAEKAKIQGWSLSFDFELTEPFLTELYTLESRETVIESIVARVNRSNSDGIVAASTEFLRRADLLNHLQAALASTNKLMWIADLGSLPFEMGVSEKS